MGFLKRFFSMGTRKSKKRQQSRRAEQVQIDDSGRIVRTVEPWQSDSEATRLLRSSSAHFAVVPEVDYSSLPPLPHPINGVLNTPVSTPARSTSSTVKRSGTYTVTVHGRTTHSRTEFPKANPPLNGEVKDTAPHADIHYFDESPTKTSHLNPKSVPFTPRDQSRLHRLRQDPSVASLLNMYDDKGRIQSSAFSNTPPSSAPVHEVVGREQVKRSGSTLRQLMGGPDEDRVANCTAMEGDISWAERELARIDRTSMLSFTSTSSAPVETPKDTHFVNDHSAPHVVTNTTFASDNSHFDSSADWPIISSLEVELSGTTSFDPDNYPVKGVPASDYQDMDTQTPQRASEVFGFLTERRKSILERNRGLSSDRDLPPLPALSVSGLTHPSTQGTLPASLSSTPALTITSTNSTNSSPMTSSDTSSAQIHTATLAKLIPMSRSTDTLNILYTPSSTNFLVSSPNVIQSSKIPRGPRPAPVAGSSSGYTQNTPQISLSRQETTSSASTVANDSASLQSRIPKSSSRAHDPYTPVRTRPHRRTASRTSTTLAPSDGDGSDNDTKVHASKMSGNRSRRPEISGKENSPSEHESVPKGTYAPKTPAARSYSRALFEARHPNLMNGEPPSPASSNELSPITQEMMSDLRKKRMHAREQMRVTSGRGLRR